MVVGGPLQGKYPQPYPQSRCVNKIISLKTHIKGMAVGGPSQAKSPDPIQHLTVSIQSLF